MLPSLDRRVRALRRAKRLNNAMVHLLSGVLDGVLLGAVTDEMLGRLDEQSYDDQRQYHDDDYNRSGLWHWEQTFVDKHLVGLHRIAVTGAGGGREVLALRHQAFEAIGYEPNPNLVRVGNDLLSREGFPECIRLAPRSGWPDESGEQFDAVMVGWGSYTHIPGRQVRIDFLSEARRRMPRGGPVLASFWDQTPSYRYYRTVCRVGNVLRRARGNRPLEHGDALGEMFVHFFSRRQVEEEFCAAGFDLESFETETYARAIGTTDGAGLGIPNPPHQPTDHDRETEHR